MANNTVCNWLFLVVYIIYGDWYMALIYIASALSNVKKVQAVMKFFTDAGHGISYDWTKHGKYTEDVDLIAACKAESDGVANADVVLLLQPGLLGSHVELGIAIALKKSIVIIDDTGCERKPFYYSEFIARCSGVTNGITVCLAMLDYIDKLGNGVKKQYKKVH